MSEIEKVSAHGKDIDVIEAFLKWLERNRMTIAEYQTFRGNTQLVKSDKPDRQLVLEYFELDFEKYVDELGEKP